ncbi:polyprenyl diphosphate synthase [Streptomyces klenkii]|uniref:polyprenyl diphosphate synthase n=1 Tax=Streptomyces klenkii TaxID=1420899 RepID=UPI0033A63F7A
MCTAHPTEYALIRLLPPRLRPAGWALYAAFHTADGLIDADTGSARERAEGLAEWTRALRAEAELGTSADPVRRALVDTVLCWDVDLDGLCESLTALEQDAEGRRPATWDQWRARVQAQNTNWIAQVLSLLERAGVSTPVRLKQLAGYGRLLDGLYLTDTLADLADDLARGVVTLPEEVLDAYPGAGDDLLAHRWTPAVRALVRHLLERARRWLRAGHGEIVRQLPPGADILLGAGVALFLGRLDAVERAGRAVLRRPSRPGPVTRWRVLMPARARALLLWWLVPVRVPGMPGPVATAKTGRRVPAGKGRGMTGAAALTGTVAAGTTGMAATTATAETAAPALKPVPPHPTGARPPDLPCTHRPRHVAIIMDGNGRWATERGLPRQDGHRAGVEAMLDVVHGAVEIGLPHLTVYAFSSENWKRSVDEVSHLFRVVQDELVAGRLSDHDVRLRWLGDEQGLPTDMARSMVDMERLTRDRTGLTFNVCLNYGGRAELARAAAATARAALAGDLDPAAGLSERGFARFLPYAELPDVDLLWRTGGERRISNFLPWPTVYAEVHFTDPLWPDVDRRDLWQAMTVYSGRSRRFGAAPAPRTRTPERKRPGPGAEERGSLPVPVGSTRAQDREEPMRTESVQPQAQPDAQS